MKLLIFDLAGRLGLPQSGFSASFIVQDKDKIPDIIDEVQNSIW